MSKDQLVLSPNRYRLEVVILLTLGGIKTNWNIRLKHILNYSYLLYIMQSSQQFVPKLSPSSMSAGSYMQRVKGFTANMSWISIGLIVLAVVFFIWFAYSSYKSYSESLTNYSANREGNNSNSNSNKTANLLLFYVDWCPHCKTAKPEWEELKAEYEGKNINGYNIVFTEYNCTNETAEIDELMDKYKIEGYPTIKLVKDNQIVEYDAKPTKSTMEQFLHTVL
jgi:thiol-disulfide isomerase/thioredoxin